MSKQPVKKAATKPAAKGTTKATTTKTTTTKTTATKEAANPISQADSFIRSILDSLETLDGPNDELRQQSKDTLKSLYDYARSVQPAKFAPKSALGELHTQGFSDGQIWEQMRGGIEHLTTIATKKQQEWLTKSQELLTVPTLPDEEIDDYEEEEEDEDDFDQFEDEDGFDDEDDFDEDDMDEDDEENIAPNSSRKSSTSQNTNSSSNTSKSSKLSKRKHVLDDGFFDHDEYERFANQGDLYGTEEYDGEDIDLFDPKIFADDNKDIDDKDNAAFATYKDFFGDYVPQEFDDEPDFDKDIFADGEMDGYEGEFDHDDDYFNSLLAGEGEFDDSAQLRDDFDAMFGDDDEDDEDDEYDEDDEMAFLNNNGNKKRKAPSSMFDDDGDDDGDDIAPMNDGDANEYGNNQRQKNSATIGQNEAYMKIDDDNVVMDHLLSPYDERRNKLTAQIDALEREISGPKAWDMRGESSGYHRHKDDLVHHDIDFEHGVKISAPITADVALQFEQIIIARIRDNAFDDVQLRVVEKDTDIYAKLGEKDQNELSTAKPKFGLAEQYEKEYKQLAQGFGEENEELQKKYRDISHAFAMLTNQLDALCNYHYTAKVHVKELTVTDSASVINKTEIAPVHTNVAAVTQGSMLTTTTSVAPQELHMAKSDGLETSKSEMSKAEKDAAIRRRKTAKKQHREHQDQNLQQKAKEGDKGAQKKVEQDKFAKEYAKITKSGQVTVHATATKGGGKNKGVSHNYTTMAGMVDAVKHNEQQVASGAHKKINKGGMATKQQTHSRSIMQ